MFINVRNVIEKYSCYSRTLVINLFASTAFSQEWMDWRTLDRFVRVIR